MPEIIKRSAARQLGLDRYFTGKPCKRGHAAERRITGVCVACSAAWYEENREKILRASVAWLAINRSRKSETAAARYLRDREKINKQNAAYQKAHPEAARRRQKAHWKRYPHKRNAHRAKSREAIRRATPPWVSASAIVAIYAEAERLTRKTGVAHEVDHIVPLVSPWVCGLHVPANLAVKTASENRKKGNLWWPDMPDFLSARAIDA